MTTCKVCGHKVRKTTLAMILRDGKLKSARVCQPCESKLGVTIVVAREVPRCKCGNPATKCHVCAGSRIVGPELAGAIKTVKGWLMASKIAVPQLSDDARGHQKARIEALESVVELLQGGRF